MGTKDKQFSCTVLTDLFSKFVMMLQCSHSQYCLCVRLAELNLNSEEYDINLNCTFHRSTPSYNYEINILLLPTRYFHL